MEKRHRNARCNNIAEQLKGAQKPINDLKKCLIAEVKFISLDKFGPLAIIKRLMSQVYHYPLPMHSPNTVLMFTFFLQCLNTSGISMTECVNPPKQNITGSNPLSIDKTLPVS